MRPITTSLTAMSSFCDIVYPIATVNTLFLCHFNYIIVHSCLETLNIYNDFHEYSVKQESILISILCAMMECMGLCVISWSISRFIIVKIFVIYGIGIIKVEL